ncbi:MAG: hypothetical protein BWY40_01202 [bacterium ADurb.Bin270]|nr:MAG: hypothetical protein BWY40_01202 [bacterium ADurb.Bin270]
MDRLFSLFLNRMAFPETDKSTALAFMFLCSIHPLKFIWPSSEWDFTSLMLIFCPANTKDPVRFSMDRGKFLNIRLLPFRSIEPVIAGFSLWPVKRRSRPTPPLPLLSIGKADLAYAKSRIPLTRRSMGPSGATWPLITARVGPRSSSSEASASMDISLMFHLWDLLAYDSSIMIPGAGVPWNLVSSGDMSATSSPPEPGLDLNAAICIFLKTTFFFEISALNPADSNLIPFIVPPLIEPEAVALMESCVPDRLMDPLPTPVRSMNSKDLSSR